MNEKEFLKKVIDALRCYWSPFITVGNSIDLTLANAQINLKAGTFKRLDSSDEQKIENNTYFQQDDGFVFDLSARLTKLDQDTYLLVFGSPAKHEWYFRGLIIPKVSIQNLYPSKWRRPETH